ncbi:TraR/DksA C4-type zinc finger protein [Galbibacter sp. EGI 63066]|uniref:TraR/DksA family transcriptional regulator n=1 Tax=Galbibacter sp. EGI 63066 TaxID=2993559 RepID=UPI002248CD45|nr:TraR/DksA C4-type zinc finger protein [Galbibacter sp. EGI 63066]MCX2679132.1 TraR/DksA C4-type zinc finger protein [Galbibacter sp. EGI 63066]
MLDKTLFIEKVKQEISKLEKTIALYKGMTNPVSPDNAIGRVSRMDAINNKSVNDAALREAEQRHKKMLLVLEKVNDADFGICRKCKQPIPEGRLLIRPESVLCVNCAQ